MREKTERPEGIVAGVVKLVGTSTEGIFENTQNLIDDTDAYTSMHHTESLWRWYSLLSKSCRHLLHTSQRKKHDIYHQHITNWNHNIVQNYIKR